MKRILLVLTLVLGTVSIASAQYPQYYGTRYPQSFQPYYYAPPVQYRYDYIYQNPQPGFPNGFYMQSYRATPQNYPYGYPSYVPTYSYGMGW